MKPIPPRSRRVETRRSALGRGLCVGGLFLVAGAAVAGESAGEPPEGFPAGRAIFAPYFTSEFLADDNIFRLSEENDPISDLLSTFTLGVATHIPIRNSGLEIGYEGSRYTYRDSTFSGSESHTGSVLFNAEFGTFDSLTVEEVYIDGVTQIQRFDFDSNEIVRQGIPFARNFWSVEWRREAIQKPSWRAKLGRVDHQYKSADVLPWVDYRGFNVEYEYGQPIYRRGYLTAYYEGRRQEHFEAGQPITGVPGDVPLRREDYDGIELGFRGVIGRNQPLSLSLGYGKLAFRDVQINDGMGDPTPYRGLVGDFRWRLPVGSGANIDLSLVRRPLSSSFNTYYIVNELRAQFDRRFLQVSRFGVSVLATNNRYGDVLTSTVSGGATLDCGDEIRRDQRQQVLGFWEWFIQPRIAFRVTADHNRRSSNCELANYRANGVGVIFKVGWF